MSGPECVLKIVFGDEFHRVQLEGQPPDLATVQRTLRLVWGDRHGTEPVAKYVDEEGDFCTLVPASFEDFLDTAMPGFDENSGKRPVLKVTLFEHSFPLQTEEAASPERAESTCSSGCDDFERVSAGLASDLSDYEVVSLGELPKTEEQEPLEEPEIAEQAAEGLASTATEEEEPSACPSEADQGSGDDMEQEARALVEQARRACEEDLREHFKNWLSTKPQELSYEAWIQAVHPENARDCIDSRMYLQASFHRQLWNSIVADGLSTEEERERLHVHPSDGPREVIEAPGSSMASQSSLPSMQEATGRFTLFLRGLIGGPEPTQEAETQAGEESSEVREASSSLSESVVWKEEAADWLAARLPIACAKLHAWMLPDFGLPEDLRPGMLLFVDALREAGTKYQAVADAAACLTHPDPRVHRGAVAKLVARAAALPREGRLFYSRALIACCPQVLIPVLPAYFRADTDDREEAEAARIAARMSCNQRQKQAKIMAREAKHFALLQAKARAEEAKNFARLQAAKARRCALDRLRHHPR